MHNLHSEMLLNPCPERPFLVVLPPPFTEDLGQSHLIEQNVPVGQSRNCHLEPVYDVAVTFPGYRVVIIFVIAPAGDVLAVKINMALLSGRNVIRQFLPGEENNMLRRT